ncbi:endolytic transglycosylase MltG [Amylibacter sp. SFDW26]|uniref:endolytic transglycosylase MltG n=1 Tax=Amylibacter sp. SFDW26 TaxID=2652722 RepID=UPI0012621449|nr:endolytic transglycosylase MltG [Amylibacter sp. SFDW26]KAB7616088.1 endolytic transglycosylase MltG [Amylibacter sp. SFDW26]
MNKHFAANFFNLLIIGMIALAGLVYWAKTEFYKPGPLAEAIFIEVPRGGNMRNVSIDLEEKGAVSHGTIMRVASDYLEKSNQLKFGNYEIPAGASMSDILDIVTKGGRSNFRYVARYNVKVAGPAELILRERTSSDATPSVITAFTVGEEMPEAYVKLIEAKTPISYQVSMAEGATSWQFVEALKAADFLDGEAPAVPAEGTLAPNTYEVRRGALRSEVLEQLMSAQTKILADAWEGRAKGLPLKSPMEALTLASIIEKETGVSSEREEVSGVFVNRLNKGMKLQTDPTVIYGITKGQGTLGRGLRRSELSKKTEYNTYIIPALPPGPIANPGKAAIEAALNPAPTKNLFFVADGSGGHAFAETLRQHNVNVAKWRKIEAEKRRKQQQEN